MIKDIYSKSILRKHKRIDSWFVSSYGMNLYRGCMHDCSYCDGRSEKYNVHGDFGKDVEVKVNAVEILEKELNPEKKRHPLKRGYILLGGGVCDTYQTVEKKYLLSRKTLELISKLNYPVHILTKSTLVLKDIDLISKINHNSCAIISFSFSSCNNEMSRVFEPCVPLPSERLETIKIIKEQGISCGFFLMPVIPYVTDTAEIMEESISRAKDAGVDFIIFGGMTLKDGKQKNHFLNVLSRFNPSLIKKYDEIYYPSVWGNASSEYNKSISNIFFSIVKKYHIPIRIPLNLFSDILSENDKITVMLDHLQYINQINSEESFFGLAANSISQLKKPVSEIKDELTALKGIGNFTNKIILEIIETGTCKYFENKMKT
ncbi:MAG: radical SAM protein [Bacteroidota bacterium]